MGDPQQISAYLHNALAQEVDELLGLRYPIVRFINDVEVTNIARDVETDIGMASILKTLIDKYSAVLGRPNEIRTWEQLAAFCIVVSREIRKREKFA